MFADLYFNRFQSIKMRNLTLILTYTETVSFGRQRIFIKTLLILSSCEMR